MQTLKTLIGLGLHCLPRSHQWKCVRGMKKFWRLKKYAAIILRFELFGFTIEYCVQKCRQVWTNSVDPDHTSGPVWSGSTRFAQNCLSKNLGPLRHVNAFEVKGVRAINVGVWVLSVFLACLYEVQGELLQSPRSSVSAFTSHCIEVLCSSFSKVHILTTTHQKAYIK